MEKSLRILYCKFSKEYCVLDIQHRFSFCMKKRKSSSCQRNEMANVQKKLEISLKAREKIDATIYESNHFPTNFQNNESNKKKEERRQSRKLI